MGPHRNLGITLGKGTKNKQEDTYKSKQKKSYFLLGKSKYALFWGGFLGLLECKKNPFWKKHLSVNNFGDLSPCATIMLL